MNFVHTTSYQLSLPSQLPQSPFCDGQSATLAELPLQSSKTEADLSQKVKDLSGKGYRAFKLTFDQVKLQDPNIGCGHFIRAFSGEFNLKKCLARQDFNF